MSNRFPPNARPSQSANDNGPLTSGQVKALKITIAVMSFMIVAALVAILARVVYLASTKKSVPSTSVSHASSSELVPAATLALPSGADIKSMSLHGNRLLVYYSDNNGHAAAILDLTTGKTMTKVKLTTGQSQ